MVMKKLRTATAAALAVVFAVGAWAQPKAGDYVSGAFEVYAGNNTHTYALEEIVGTGSVSGYPTYAAPPVVGTTARSAVETLLGFGAKDEMRPYVVLEARSAGAMMPEDSRGMITFALSGAKFAARVSNSDLVAVAAMDNVDLTAAALEGVDTFAVLQIAEGGGVGDSSVTFEVQIDSGGSPAQEFGTPRPADTDSNPNNDHGDAFVLKLPALDEVSPGGVSVTVSTDSITTDFPVVDMVERWVDMDGRLEADDVAISARVIGRAADAVMLTVVPETSTADIDIEGRMHLVSGDGGMTSLIHVGSLGVALAPGVLQSNGEAFGFDAGGAGHVVVTVHGVDDTDTVFLDAVTSGTSTTPMAVDTGEELAVSDGMATDDFSLSGLPASSDLYVMVDGERTLSPGTIRAEASISFQSGIRDLMWLTTPPWIAAAQPAEATVDVRYAGTHGILPRAYAIAPAGSGTGDISNVRIRCDDSSECQVYLACTDSMGNDVFGKVGTTIPARATMVLRDGGSGTAMDLREVFDEDAWMSGRLSCDVIAPDRNVEVQVLTRSGGALVNNTYVDGGDGGG